MFIIESWQSITERKVFLSLLPLSPMDLEDYNVHLKGLSDLWSFLKSCMKRLKITVLSQKRENLQVLKGLEGSHFAII